MSATRTVPPVGETLDAQGVRLAQEAGRYGMMVSQLHDALLRRGVHATWCSVEVDGTHCTCGLVAALQIGKGDAWR